MSKPISQNSSFPSKLKHTLKAHTGAVLFVRFNRDGNFCLSGGQDKYLKLWNPHAGLHIKTYQGHGYEVLDVDVSKDNSIIASCGGDKLVFVWDVATGRVIRKFHGHTSRVNCIQYNGEDSVLVSGSYDKTVKIWDCRSRSNEPIQDLDDAKDSVSSLIVTDTEIITASIDGNVRTYDIRLGRLRTDHINQPVTSIVQSNDNNCYLLNCLDSTTRLLDKDSGELLNSYKGHVNNTYKIGCTISNNDAFVMSGSEDNLIYYWDLVEASSFKTLKGHSNIVCGLSYHPSLPVLLSSSVDGTIGVWST